MNIELSPVRSSSLAFRGNFVQKISENMATKVANAKVFKDCTVDDVNNLRAYIQLKPYSLGITPQEIAELSKFDGIDFIANSYNYLITKMKYPPEIVPQAMLVPNLNKGYSMGYSPAQNIMCIHSDLGVYEGVSKQQLFALLRHEFQHYIQNVNIIRHKTLGHEALERYSEVYAAGQKQLFINLIESGDDGLVKQNLPAETMPFFENIKALYLNNDMEGFNKIFEDLKSEYKLSYSSFRDKVVAALGEIDENSSLTPKLQGYLDEFCNVNYLKSDSSVDLNKYVNVSSEADAMNAQAQADFEFSGVGCFFKWMKNEVAGLLNNPETLRQYEELTL